MTASMEPTLGTVIMRGASPFGNGCSATANRSAAVSVRFRRHNHYNAH